MVKKEHNYSKILKKIFGLILIFIFISLAYKSIDKFRNFFGIFLSMNCIIIIDTLVKVFLPNKIISQNSNN
tara:strand:+ start:197 stop:409 length:213 start_codon:yes stop_codon:yes gene_type:complete